MRRRPVAVHETLPPVPGAHLVVGRFDEYVTSPGWKDHEREAWAQFVAEPGITPLW